MTSSELAHWIARRRPATGVGTPVHVRCSDEFLATLDAWRRRQADLPSRSEAIRRLVEEALTHERPWRAGPHKGAWTARAMAAEELDRLGDTSATEEERQNRKRRILKGPPEFREMRKDLPKPKQRARSIPVAKLDAKQ
jgi:Arc/MetJ-type ribon-helix-helix transcriptional regulator